MITTIQRLSEHESLMAFSSRFRPVWREADAKLVFHDAMMPPAALG
jgi:hypothetical protein